jgi:transposase
MTLQGSTGNSLLSFVTRQPGWSLRPPALLRMSRRELGVSETSLGNWVRAYREKHAEDEPPLQVSERARLRELERENRELRMKADFLSKAAAYFAAEHR